MNNKDVEVLKKMFKNNKVEYCESQKEYEEEQQTLSNAISLAKELEQAKGIIPEEKFKNIWDGIVPDLLEEQYPKGKCEGRGKVLLFQALLYCKLTEVIALNLVKFKKRLPEILKSVSVGNHDDDSCAVIPSWLIEPISLAILSKSGCERRPN